MEDAEREINKQESLSGEPVTAPLLFLQILFISFNLAITNRKECVII